MDLITWINGNGVTVMLIWGAILLVAGTMPPLPDDASYFAKWFYATMKFLSLNARGVTNSLQQFGVNVKLPTMQISKGTGPMVGTQEAEVNKILGVTGSGPGTAVPNPPPSDEAPKTKGD